ncbi:hypothetical protein ACFWFR_11955 [Oerskovia sp. NPDC060287]|uniref:hypothetical protein n=1 Tax=Oerskovia sp. NPDC060287 TaxID=3347095 RepID=UPI0036652E26
MVAIDRKGESPIRQVAREAVLGFESSELLKVPVGILRLGLSSFLGGSCGPVGSREEAMRDGAVCVVLIGLARRVVGLTSGRTGAY